MTDESPGHVGHVPAAAILAIKRENPQTADMLLETVARRAYDSGLRLTGALQHEVSRDGRRKCDMVLTDLGSRREIRISEDRGAFAAGCRLDRLALTEAATSIERAVRAEAPDLMILNKFARAEEEGRGMRDAVVAALECGAPVLLGVAMSSLTAFEAFGGAFCTIITADSAVVETWLRAHFSNRLKPPAN